MAKTLDVMNNANFTWHTSINGLLSGSNIRFYQTVTGSYKECTNARHGHRARLRLLGRIA